MGAPVHRLSIKGILWIWSVICSMKCSSQNSCKMSMPDFFLILQFVVCIPDQLNTLDCSVVNISPSIQLSRKEPSFYLNLISDKLTTHDCFVIQAVAWPFPRLAIPAVRSLPLAILIEPTYRYEKAVILTTLL
jgi:hypothetical protein